MYGGSWPQAGTGHPTWLICGKMEAEHPDEHSQAGAWERDYKFYQKSAKAIAGRNSCCPHSLLVFPLGFALPQERVDPLVCVEALHKILQIQPFHARKVLEDAAEEIIAAWNEFQAEPQKLRLPSAPAQPVVYMNAADRPQPRFDSDLGAGMTTAVGRLRRCNVLDWKFTVLSHNTIRGAAGAALLNAELLKAKGYLG